jgi:hypothetical protein
MNKKIISIREEQTFEIPDRKTFCSRMFANTQSIVAEEFSNEVPRYYIDLLGILGFFLHDDFIHFAGISFDKNNEYLWAFIRFVAVGQKCLYNYGYFHHIYENFQEFISTWDVFIQLVIDDLGELKTQEINLPCWIVIEGFIMISFEENGQIKPVVILDKIDNMFKVNPENGYYFSFGIQKRTICTWKRSKKQSILDAMKEFQSLICKL